jgi:hypothetical protein
LKEIFRVCGGTEKNAQKLCAEKVVEKWWENRLKKKKGLRRFS